MTKMQKVGELEDKDWSLYDGLTRPCHHAFESFPGRGSRTIWREIQLNRIAPLWVTIHVSYDNSLPESGSGPAGGSTIGAGGGSPPAQSADVWSDDEDDANFRLPFACKPYLLPLSMFFQPFHGFDSPAGGVFPPPAVFTVCEHSRQVDGERLCELSTQKLVGLHRVHDAGCYRLDESIVACYAGISFDGSALLVLLCRRSGRGSVVSELRSTSKDLLAAFAAALPTWLQAAVS